MAGINSTSPAKDFPHLYVQINVHNNSFHIFFAYQRTIKFMVGSVEYMGTGATWYNGALGSGSGDDILKCLDAQLDQFIAEYTIAKPQ